MVRAHVHYISHMVLDVPVPQAVEQLLEVPKIIHQDRILQRTETDRRPFGSQAS